MGDIQDTRTLGDFGARSEAEQYLVVPDTRVGVFGLLELDEFAVGRAKAQVAVLEVDPVGRRIRLSKKAVAHHREQAELREYAERPDAAPTASLGSLADNLRNALKGR